MVYKNIEDLKDFFKSNCLSNAKTIVVNSYYDKESEQAFKNIAVENDADYLTVPNKGYGAGNNRGVEYALEHYEFKYLVISNADVNIQKMSIDNFAKYPHGIYAPSIHTLSGKQQNPHMPYHCAAIDKMKYHYFKKNNWHVIMLFCAVNKMLRMWFSFCNLLGARKVYSAHGAFVILPYDISKLLYPFYDEDVFLFTEEENLAQVAKAHSVLTYFVPEIEIKHKEDGSTSTIAEKQRDITRESYLTYWKKWYK